MKTIYLILISFFFTLITSAQSSNDIGKIALSVVIPENVEGLNASQLSKLETKIIQLVTNTGLAAFGFNNNFVIYPKFVISESNIVEGGMQNITVVTAEINLFIKQVDNNILFSTISKSLKGSGNSQELAITNAISKINANDSDYKVFIETGKSKIIKYYESKCQDIITKSESLVKMQDYEQALGVLMTVPEEVSCYSKIQEKSIEVYKSYQIQKCKAQLQEARIQIASNNYSVALNILSQIDPSTPCFNESQALINTVTSKVNVEEKKQWDLKMKVYNNEVALEKERINAIKDIAVAYYKSKPASVNYNYIIK